MKYLQKTSRLAHKCESWLPRTPQQEKWRRRSACRVVNIYDAFANPQNFDSTERTNSQALLL